jgi:pimeloyl-ACP methyl ester carboxylesterase
MQQTATINPTAERVPTSPNKAVPVPGARTVVSTDGTAIAFDLIGQGAPVILVDGALCHRRMGQVGQLAELLAPHFTVITHDRRGRGASGDTSPYAVDREIEDIAALLNEAGGSACLWGMSSGAVLAIEAARRLMGIKRLALYEAPFIVDDSRSSTENQWAQIREAVAAGRRGAAVTAFLQMVGVPRLFIGLMRLSPIWAKLKAIAHTLPYDGALVQDHQMGRPLSAERWASVTAPTLVMDGGKSPQWMRNGNRALAFVLRNAQYCTLEGQTHMLRPKAHVPTLVEFFKSRA